MSYLGRKILFATNLILILGAAVLSIYSIITFFMVPGEWLWCFSHLSAGVLSGTLLILLNTLRRAKYPVPGIDYK